MRSVASRTAPSGRPTVVVCGRPVEMSTSTSTTSASMPRRAPERTRASMTVRVPRATGWSNRCERNTVLLRVRAPEALECGRRLGGALERPPVAAALEKDELASDACREPLGEARRDVGIVATPQDQRGSGDARDVVLPLVADEHGGAIEAENARLHRLVDVRSHGARVLR